MRISLSPLSGSSASEGISDAVNTLRAELDACSHHTQRALLHYELALLYEQVRDDHSAAKELLLAVNGDSSLHEPLEHLIALMERRRSHVNLGKLLDRLGRVARSPEESVRAQLARGDYLIDQRADLAAALTAYDQAAQLLPDNSLVWLSLHYLAARQSDAKLLETALTRRIQLAHNKGYRDSLRLQLARFQAMRGRQDLARATVEAATSPNSPVLYPALLQLEQLVLKADEHSTRALLLEQQAEVLSRGLENHEHARGRGIPPSHTSVSRLIDVTLRATVNLEAATARESRALDSLERAFRYAPDSRVLVRALRRINTQANQPTSDGVNFQANPIASDRLLELAQVLDATGPEEVDSSLWLDQALVAHKHAETELFKQFVDQALRHYPRSVVGRALQLENYWANQRFTELAVAYEQLASDLAEPSSQVHAYLLAAVSHVLASDPKERTLSALNGATVRGAKKIEQWHMTLAQLCNDREWGLESLRRQIHSGGPLEVPARLHAVRQTLQTGDHAALEAHLDALTQEPHSQRVGLLLRATLPRPTSDTTTRMNALQTLSNLTDGDTRVGLQRFLAEKKREQGHTGTARADLTALHETAPSDPTTTLQLVPLLLEADDPESAVKVLTETATANPEPEVRQQFHTHAGIIAYRNKAPDAALRAFTQASHGPSNGCVEPLRWALRAALPNDPAMRRKVLELPVPADDLRAVQALERFALEIGFGNQKSAATSALSDADELAFDEVGEAIQLARALWTECTQNEEAIRHLQTQSSLGKELVAATAFYKQRAELTSTTDALLPLAEEWAAQGSLAAALEWLGAAVNSGQPEAEVKARRALANVLEAPIRDYVSSETTLIEHFAGLPTEAPKLDSDAAKLANAELTSPMSAPRARALGLTGLIDVFENSPGSEYTNTLRLMAAYNHLGNQDFPSAQSLFAAITLEEPTDLAAWEGLLECATALGSKEQEAKALMEIGFLHGDTTQAAAALRNAASLFLDSLAQPEPGYRCLTRAVELDITDTTAFARLLKHAKSERAHERIVALTSARLSVAESAKELTKLHWERARAFRDAGNLEQALADLGNVGLLDPTHVGAKALAGDIYISQQDYRNAASELSDLALLPNAPAEQRRLGAITAVDLFENKLDDIDAALELFNRISEADLDLLPVAEKLVAACAKAKRWEETLVLSRYLSTNAPTAAERAQAARLQLAVHRDELHRPEGALECVEALLVDNPGDPEAVDTLLDGVFNSESSRALLRQHLPSILQHAAQSTDLEGVVRVARVAEELDDLELRLVTLGAMVCKSGIESDTVREIEHLLGHTANYPEPATNTYDLSLLVDENEHGPLVEILRLLAPHLPEVLGPTVSSLGLGRKERRAALESQYVRPQVMAFAHTLGLRDFEYFLAPQLGESITAIAAVKEPAIIIGGADRVLTPLERGRLATCIFGLVRGTHACIEYPASRVAALLTAACKIGNVELPGPTFAHTGELERQLSRELPRKVRKELEPLAQQAAAAGVEPLSCVRAVTATLDRVAVLASGDLSQTLSTRDALGSGFASLEPTVAERLQALTQFCLSTTYINLRQQLGLSAK